MCKQRFNRHAFLWRKLTPLFKQQLAALLEALPSLRTQAVLHMLSHRLRTSAGVVKAVCNRLCVGEKLLADAEVNVIHIHHKVLNLVEVWEFLKVFHDGFLLSVSQNIEDLLLLGRSQYALKRLSTRISTKLVN